jgi:uncharacterized protein YjiS (DUF1127 family)
MTTALATPSGAGVLTTGSERDLGSRRDGLRLAWERYRAYRTSVAALGALSDRQLADAGIARAAIPQHARAAVYGK